MKSSNPSVLVLAALVTMLCGAASSQETRRGARVEDLSPSSERFRAVACALPPRVRRLGSVMTYLERRRVIETNAYECEKRQGEYTVYDPSNDEESIAFWKKAAEDADSDAERAKAQTYVGELYEKRVGAPDPAEAARWYALAAQNGGSRAKLHLAYLYEQGLGVERDPTRALNLWRDGMNIDEALVPESELVAARSDAQRRIDGLTADLERQNQVSAQLQKLVGDNLAQVERQRAALAAARSDAAALAAELERERARTGADPARIAALERELAAKAQTNDSQAARIALLETQVGAQRAQLDASAAAAAIHESELKRALDAAAEQERASSALAAELSRRDTLIRELERGTAVADEALENRRARLEELQAEIDRLRAEGRAQEALIAEKDAEAVTLAERIAAADAKLAAQELETESLRDQLNAAAAAGRAADTRELTAKVEALNRQLAEQAGTIQMLRAERTALLSETESLKGDLAARDGESSAREGDLRARLTVLEADLVRLTGEHEAASQTLERERAEKETLRRDKLVLEGQVGELRASTDQALTSQRRDVEQMLADISGLETQIAQKNQTILGLRDSMNRLELEIQRLSIGGRQLVSAATPVMRGPRQSVRIPADVDLGRYDYHALIIGNSDYASINDLPTVRNDVEQVRILLEQVYGFKVKMRSDLTLDDMFAELDALHDYDENDIVLIYYAGHGTLDQFNNGYWQPVDYQPGKEPSATAVSVTQITQYLNMMSAKHVLVVADSCYSGALLRDSSIEIDNVEQRLKHWLNNASRTVLTSGGLEPVLDSGNGRLSVFASAFIDVLADNMGILSGEALHSRIRERIRRDSSALEYPQTPLFAGLADAGHANGQFVFVPRGER